LLVAENTDIRANPSGRVVGTVIEATLDRTKGVLATLLVQNGTLNVNDVVVIGTAFGRLRGMFDYTGKRVRKAGPSTPVSVMGLSEVPQAGDVFQVMESEKEARNIVEARKQARQQTIARPASVVTLEELFDRFQAGEVRELRLIVKADVQGSLEPIINSLKDLNTGEIKINVLYAETGNIGENDVMLASASKAVIIGFDVTADTAAQRLAEAEGVSIRRYNIIYRLVEDVEKALKGMLEPVLKEVVIGRAEVRAVFRISKIGNVAGCYIRDGEVRRNSRVHVLRQGQQVFDGEVSSLRHLQEDVREVRAGYECGVSVKSFTEFQVGDILECYVFEKVAAA